MDGVRRAAPDPAANVVIEFRNVSKTYKTILGRQVKAVEDFSLSVPVGQVFGIAGPNGAGKSTLIGMLLGFLSPTSGRIDVGGLGPRAYAERNGIGYLSELIAIPPRWRADTALQRFAILAGVEEAALPGAVDAAVARLGIEEHRKKRIKALSKGNLQRVGIAQAIAQDAQIFVLDEPTHGLDPVWTQRFRDIVNELRGGGRVILIASHNLDELERLCDQVAIIDHGRLQRVVNVRAAATDSGTTRYRVSVLEGAELLRAKYPNAIDRGGGEFEIDIVSLASLNRTLGLLMADGVVVSSVQPAHSALERQFREAVGEEQ